jgi:hypothetical protein
MQGGSAARSALPCRVAQHFANEGVGEMLSNAAVPAVDLLVVRYLSLASSPFSFDRLADLVLARQHRNRAGQVIVDVSALGTMAVIADHHR